MIIESLASVFIDVIIHTIYFSDNHIYIPDDEVRLHDTFLFSVLLRDLGMESSGLTGCFRRSDQWSKQLRSF